MSNRKVILLLSFVFILITYSQISGGRLNVPQGLPNPEWVDGNELANVPPAEVAIQSIQDRIKQNPQDAVSYMVLGDLYIRQGRETGDISAYQRAEESLKRSLDLLPGYSPAGSLLASVYYVTHDFEKALDLGEQVYESDTKNSQARIIVADSYLSLGNYQEAEAIYKEIDDSKLTPPILARLANLAELKGNPDEALILIRQAAGDTLRSGGTKENAAWYLLRVGDIYFNLGRLNDASGYYGASLRVYDNYYLALAGLGRVRAAEGKYDEAISYFQKAVNIVPQPDFLAALGDLYTITGQSDKAQLQYKTVDYIGKIATLNQQVYNRQLANFYSDHDLKLDEALRLSLAELETRKDVYGYDAAAWAYYKNGKYREAQAMMDQALALGTRDARLYYHAGMIAYALQNNEQARQYLDRALKINPHFSILQSVEAQKRLKTLLNVATE